MELTGGRFHAAHVSTAGAVALIREAKARGLPVTAEVTPHHLTLTDEAVRGYDPVTKVNPPLRTADDVQALRAAIADGTIDAIATDHAPHSVDEKEFEYDRAPFGMTGVETALGVVLTELVAGGVIDLARLVQLMSAAPRRIIGLEPVAFTAGAPADLTLVDPDARWVVEPRAMLSRSRNTPFAGRELVGRAVATLVDGRIVHDARPVQVPGA